MTRKEQRRAWVEVDMKALRRNVEILKKMIPNGAEMMAVLKGNGYGYGSVDVAWELTSVGITDFCVATVDEAAELREAGIMGDILILGWTHPEDSPLLLHHDLIQSVLDEEYAEVLDDFGSIRVHIKVDTGMRRLGVLPENIDQVLAAKNLRFEGIYTHLGTCIALDETSEAFVRLQVKRFDEAVAIAKALRPGDWKEHILASYGLLNYPEESRDMLRIGMSLFGIYNTAEPMAKRLPPFEPVLTLKARISSVRALHGGEYQGYAMAYRAKREMKIATLSIGYTDGVPRELSQGGGEVLIHGTRAPIIGRIYMDQLVVDVTECPPVKAGDVAVLIGRDGREEIIAGEMAERSHSVATEITSRLGSRLPRIALNRTSALNSKICRAI